ncbi:MAG: acyltransferase, partial [Bacteroidaceae bacterium]|nr:acyltransferase [Bacteroidaceae bacterium]
VHSGHERNVRSAMKEIFVPLVIGNITTVGAFMALVPLQSTALRDLGLFASFLLVGTILFVVVYLPHFVKIKTAGSETKMLNLLARFCPEEYGGIVRLVVILTLVFGWFSFGAEFDSNMANINYMTDEQRSEMAYFQQILSGDSATNVQTVYVVSSDSTFDGALAESQKKQSTIDSLVSAGTVASHAGVRQFIASESEQSRRLERWKRFVGEHRDVFGRVLSEESVKAGFSADAFSEFQMLVADTASLSAKPFEYFAPLTQQVFSGNLSFDKETSKCAVVDILKVDESRVGEVEALFSHSFDVQSMNSAISDSLSDNFNYIGWACSLIVFFFLWFSFGRIELAILSFLPMAVSWVWILGIMAIFGIKFNIVNIILATFIFGQGDDYTIFMTEGCQSEYAYRKPILASYKSSIIQSALIMFVGIGTLVVAKHPALFSLAIVTIIGMFCVVFMAYLLPPLLFGIVTAPKRPVSLASACRTLLLGILLVVEMPLIAMLRPMRMSLRNSGISLLHQFNLRLLFGVKIKRIKAADDAFGKSSVVVFNHRSMLDAMLIVALNRNIILKSKMPESIWQKIFLWLCGCSCDNVDVLLGAGCSVALLTDEASACEVAKALKADILPVVIHGSDKIKSDESLVINGGTVTISVEKKVSYSDSSVPEKISARYDELCRNIEKSNYFVGLVKDLYMYRGVDIMRSVNRNLRRNGNYSAIVDAPVSAAKVVIDGVGYGEAALLFALVHPDVQVVAVEADADKRTVAQNCIGEVAPNVEVVESCLADDSALVINLKK